MEEKSYFEAKGMDLLNQLEQVLENDPLINEVGFIHPSQFIKLNEEVTISQPSSAGGSLQSANEIFKSGMLEINTLKQEDMVFWNRDHKLGISTEVLLPLYRAAKHAFMVAIQHYRICTGVSARDEKSKDGDKLCSFFSSQNTAESDVMRHSRALLLLSSDFGTAWNSRKLILSKKQGFSIYMNELLLSTMVLSYSPKSEHAWSHRRWAIRMIAGDCSNLQEIVNKESELVEKVAEKSKMNYRAWNYRCQLATYMTVAQVRCELKSSRNWAASHVADNCCFHYRRRLLCRLLEDYCSEQDVNASSGCRFDIYKVWKEELDWNEILILRYIGREVNDIRNFVGHRDIMIKGPCLL